MIFNASGGGGGGGFSPNAAILHCTAATGATVTFSKDGVIVKVIGPTAAHVNAKNPNMADYYLSVSQSNYGEWTVSAVGDTGAASLTLIVDTNRQYDIDISLDFYIVSLDGVMLDSSEYTKSASYAPTISQYPGYVRVASANGNSQMGLVYTTEKIDISDLNYLYVDYLGAATNYQGAAWWLGLINNPSEVSSSSTAGFAAKVQMPVKSTRGVVYLDISTYQGEYYLGFTACGHGGGAVKTADIYTMAAVAVLPD